MKDDFGYEGRRRRRVALAERLRTLPLVATGVFTAALILLIFTAVSTPVTWNDALPWDTEPSAAPVAEPIDPDAPAAHSPAPQTSGARPSAQASGSPAAGATPSPVVATPSPSPSPSAPPPAPRTVRYEAESASGSQARVANNHPGYSGSGFVDYENVAGGFVQWTVQAGAGQAMLRLRFANASCCGRTMDILVNGSAVLRDVRFEPTPTWDAWATVTVTVTLNGGTDTVRVTATGSTGGPNIDYLEVVQ